MAGVWVHVDGQTTVDGRTTDDVIWIVTGTPVTQTEDGFNNGRTMTATDQAVSWMECKWEQSWILMTDTRTHTADLSRRIQVVVSSTCNYCDVETVNVRRYYYQKRVANHKRCYDDFAYVHNKNFLPPCCRKVNHIRQFFLIGSFKYSRHTVPSVTEHVFLWRR